MVVATIPRQRVGASETPASLSGRRNPKISSRKLPNSTRSTQWRKDKRDLGDFVVMWWLMGGRNVENVVWLRRSARRESESGAGNGVRGGGDDYVANGGAPMEV